MIRNVWPALAPYAAALFAGLLWGACVVLAVLVYCMVMP